VCGSNPTLPECCSACSSDHVSSADGDNCKVCGAGPKSTHCCRECCPYFVPLPPATYTIDRTKLVFSTEQAKRPADPSACVPVKKKAARNILAESGPHMCGTEPDCLPVRAERDTAALLKTNIGDHGKTVASQKRTERDIQVLTACLDKKKENASASATKEPVASKRAPRIMTPSCDQTAKIEYVVYEPYIDDTCGVVRNGYFYPANREEVKRLAEAFPEKRVQIDHRPGGGLDYIMPCGRICMGQPFPTKVQTFAPFIDYVVWSPSPNTVSGIVQDGYYYPFDHNESERLADAFPEKWINVCTDEYIMPDGTTYPHLPFLTK